MKILMVNRGIFRVPLETSGGGAEKHGYVLTNEIANLNNEVHFVGKIGKGTSFHRRVKVHAVPPRRGVIPPRTSFFGWALKHLLGNSLSFMISLMATIREGFDFDVIHCHGALSALLLCIVIGRKIPVVYTIHDASPWIVTYPGFGNRTFRKLAYLLIDLPCQRIVHSLIVTSPGLKKELLRMGITASKIKFIPSGVAVPSEANGSIKNTSGNPAKTCYGLSVGHLVPRKRTDLIVRAASLLSDIDIRFVIVGDGPELSRLKQLSKELGVRSRVSFSGFVDDEHLKECYRNALFFCLPSTAESFPLVTLEAMAYEVPVISSNLEVYKGVLSDGMNCILFDNGDVGQLADCIRRLVRNEKFREELAANGRRFVEENFAWRRIGESVMSVYKDLLENRSNYTRSARSF